MTNLDAWIVGTLNLQEGNERSHNITSHGGVDELASFSTKETSKIDSQQSIR
jgi:hypothetical protein